MTSKNLSSHKILIFTFEVHLQDDSVCVNM